MSMVEANGVRLGYEVHGDGEIPLVLVHGSWLSRRNWDPVVPHLAESFRVITYDRRGHGESEQPGGQGSVREDAADLAALTEELGIAPAWVAGQSFGGSITLRMAAERPDLVRGIAAHEPPLFSLVADDPAMTPALEGFARLIAAVTDRIQSGDPAGAAEQFVQEGLGAGVWGRLTPEFRQMMVEEAPTYLDEARDPEQVAFDLDWVQGFPHPALLTKGDQSPPTFAPVVTALAETLPSAEVRTFAGAGHIVQVEQPADFAGAIVAFVRSHEA